MFLNACFRGVRSSEMYFSPVAGLEQTGQWIIQSLRDPSKKFVLPKKESKKYPIGSLKWTVGESEICSVSPGSELWLTLTMCPLKEDNQMYTCDSGHCIQLADKCNSKLDCQDGSDERNCLYLQVNILIIKGCPKI